VHGPSGPARWSYDDHYRRCVPGRGALPSWPRDIWTSTMAKRRSVSLRYRSDEGRRGELEPRGMRTGQTSARPRCEYCAHHCGGGHISVVTHGPCWWDRPIGGGLPAEWRPARVLAAPNMVANIAAVCGITRALQQRGRGGGCRIPSACLMDVRRPPADIEVADLVLYRRDRP